MNFGSKSYTFPTLVVVTYVPYNSEVFFKLTLRQSLKYTRTRTCITQLQLKVEPRVTVIGIFYLINN